MVSSFSLNMPTDIPWQRICVTEDMLDRRPCDRKIPLRWKSSITIYRYDPDEEYQPYEEFAVTYLKVGLTIAPFAPELDFNEIRRRVPPILIDDLEEAYPCYGAILHVTVTPRSHEQTELSDYPFIMDSEPKKRELYQMATETGEVLSGSSSSLSVGKGAVSSNTTENYNIDTGWNFGMQGSYAGTGGGHDIGETGQWGTVNRVGLENTNIRNTDVSAERRELQSHVTQLAQMYNLFQAFHLGTNRAIFLIEPRPHIRQVEAAFINGPRALEGYQEIFLTVVRKKDQKICVGAVLETAHLSKEPVEEKKTTTELFTDFRLLAKAENRDNDWGESDVTSDPISLTRDYSAPPGWIITGYEIIMHEAERVHSGPTVTFSPKQLSASGSVTWRFYESGFWNTNHYRDGFLNFDVRIFLEEEEGRIVDYVRKLFLNARQLCCCERRFDVPGGIVFETDLTAVGRVPMRRSAGVRGLDPDILRQSRIMANEIRSGMITSLSSSRRNNIGDVPFMQSDTFLTRAADASRLRRLTREFWKPAMASTILPKEVKDRIERRIGRHVPLETVMTSDSRRFGRMLGIDESDMRKLKGAILSAMTEKFQRIRYGESSQKTEPDQVYESPPDQTLE